MKQSFLLFFLLIISHANDYYLSKKVFSEKKYYVKVAAFTNQENARKIELSTEFPTQMMMMDKYYSILSQSYDSKSEAQKALTKIQKKFSDAYIITLYKNQQPIQKPVIEKKSTHYAQGLYYYKNKQYEEALAAFDRAIIQNPFDIHAKRYYAYTLYNLHFYKEAKKEFHTLLEQSLDTNIKQEIKSYLTQIERKYKKHFYFSSLTVGIGHTDNINLNTDLEITQYGPYALINDTNQTKSTYAVTALTLSHQYKGTYFDLYSRLYNYNELFHTAKGNDLHYLDISSSIIKRYQKFSFIMPLGYNIALLDQHTISTIIIPTQLYPTR